MSAAGIIRVLVVDDSAVVRDYLGHILSRDPGMEVVGFAGDGKEAIAQNEKLKPDLITMDIHMPVMNGVDATERIMRERPVPIVVVSVDHDPSEMTGAFEAMRAGAVYSLRKPRAPTHPQAASDHQALRDAVRMMSEIKVVRRRGPRSSTAAPQAGPASSAPASFAGSPRSSQRGSSAHASPQQAVRLVAIGASTGGPPVLERILGGLPSKFGAPIIIVQHIAPGFLDGMVQWLNSRVTIPVRTARQGKLLSPGIAYFAPEDHQISLSPFGRVRLHPGAPMEHKNRPSVSWMFRSVAEVVGAASVGILLTGMGQDGAIELGEIRARGGLAIAQSQESSAVWGMPGKAVEFGNADLQLDPDAIAAKLRQLQTPFSR
jgi:two-component system chemotaxis response regulator CheB